MGQLIPWHLSGDRIDGYCGHLVFSLPLESVLGQQSFAFCRGGPDDLSCLGHAACFATRVLLCCQLGAIAVAVAVSVAMWYQGAFAKQQGPAPAISWLRRLTERTQGSVE